MLLCFRTVLMLLCAYMLYLCTYSNCTVISIVWTSGQVLVLCAAFLCLSDWPMLPSYAALFCIVPFCLKLYDDDDDHMSF